MGIKTKENIPRRTVSFLYLYEDYVLVKKGIINTFRVVGTYPKGTIENWRNLIEVTDIYSLHFVKMGNILVPVLIEGSIEEEVNIENLSLFLDIRVKPINLIILLIDDISAQNLLSWKEIKGVEGIFNNIYWNPIAADIDDVWIASNIFYQKPRANIVGANLYDDKSLFVVRIKGIEEDAGNLDRILVLKRNG